MPEDEPTEDIIDEFNASPEGELKQQTQEENMTDDDFDYNQGFNHDYPDEAKRDSKLVFFRDLIREMNPIRLIRVANLVFKEKKNAKIYRDYAEYNLKEGNNLITDYLKFKSLLESAGSMGSKGFTQTNFTTQTRVVKRQAEANPKAANWSKPGQGVPR